MEVLRQLKYIHDLESEEMAVGLWEGLGGEEYGGLLAGNLQGLVEAIEGVGRRGKGVVVGGEAEQEGDKDRYKLSGELKLVLTYPQSKEIFRKYALFRHHRILAEEKIAQKLNSKAKSKSNDGDS